MTTQTAPEWTSPPADEDELTAWFHDMCVHTPVRHDPERGGWHIFGYRESVHALSNHSAFSNNLAVALPKESPLQLYRVGNLSWMDPPRHQQLRGLVHKAFTPKFVAGLEPMVAATVEKFLGEVRQKDTVSYMDEYTSPIVSTTIAQMVGIPTEDHVLFRKWSNALMSLTDPAQTKNGVRDVIENTREIGDYLHAHIRGRRKNPTDDLTSRMVESELDGERLADAEIAGLIALTLTAGQTATQTLANSIICLDQHPADAARLRANPELLESAIEEVMRFRAQTTRVARKTVTPVTLGGEEIPAGEGVSVWLAAANRDPRKFTDPEVFDITRSPNPHIGLGHGAHFCLGTPLARLEIKIALRRILEEAKQITIDYETSRLLDPRLVFGANELTLQIDWR